LASASVIEQSVEDTISLEGGLEQIYAETRGSVCAYLLYMGVPQAQAQEVTQEVYLRLHQTMRKGTAIENTRAWLFRVAHNLGLKVRSRERAFRAISPDWERFENPSGSQETALLDRERNRRVSEALESLSPQQRNCLYLRSEGLRYREIAEVMGISSSTVNEFLRRAISRLAEAAHG
jgi:RNA polymerase sigma-70 factor (ECF subfamily)